MTTRDIIAKLTNELHGGIETEVQVVYLLAGVRKLIERDNARAKYPQPQVPLASGRVPHPFTPL